MAIQWYDETGQPGQYRPNYPYDRTGSPMFGGIFGTGDVYSAGQGGGGYNPGITGSPAQQGPVNAPGGPAGPEVRPEDVMIRSGSSSYSGLWPWGNKLVKKAVTPFFTDRMGTYQGLVDKYLPQTSQRIENARQGEVRQFQRDFRDPMRRDIQGGLLRGAGGGAAGGGMLGSAFADSMARIAEQGMRAGERVHEASNVRAENRQLQAIQQNVLQNAQAMGMLGDILGLSRYGQSEGTSVNPSLWAAMLGFA